MAMPASNNAPCRPDLRGEAHIWQLRTGSSPLPKPRRERWLSWLAPQERRFYERFTTVHLRESYLAARALCRATLSHYTGVDPSRWRFRTTPNGKPTISEPAECASLRFNITHTNDLIVCIVTRCGEAGVDAEKISADVDDRLVARHFLTKRRQRELEKLPRAQRIECFFEEWVLKEAYVKARGAGLTYAPESLTVKQNSKGEPLPIANCRFTLWRPTRNHIAAAAVLLQEGASTTSIDWLKLEAGPALMRDS